MQHLGILELEKWDKAKLGNGEATTVVNAKVGNLETKEINHCKSLQREDQKKSVKTTTWKLGNSGNGSKQNPTT